MPLREKVWARLATDLKPTHLHSDIVNEITLDELPVTLQTILNGDARGRTIVRL